MAHPYYIDNFLNNNYGDFKDPALLNTPAAKKNLHAADIVLFVCVLCISLGIGLYHSVTGSKQSSTNEYFMGNRQLRVIPVTISMFMSYISAVLVLGNTAEVYMRGAQIYISAFSAAASNIVSALVFVPLLYPLKLVSSFEYLEMRFRRLYVKRVGTVLLIASQIIYMGIAMFAPATALEAVTHIPAWVSIVVCAVVGTAYTTLGGMKAVVWTDLFQGIVYLIGIIIVLAIGSGQAGGIGEVFRIASAHGRLNFITKDSFNPDPSIRLTLWTLVLGHFFATMHMALRQTTVQRFSALPTLKKAMCSVMLNVPPLIIMYTLTCMCGLVVFAYYTKIGCDPLRSGEIKNPNQLLPYFVVNVINTPGVPGMFLAVLFSGALSTISSSLHSLSAVTWKDFLECKFPHASEKKKTLITKLLVLIYGIASLFMAFFAALMSGHVMMATQSFAGSVVGPMASMFYLGIFLPCANAMGVVVGAFGGVAFGMWLAIGGYTSKPHRAYLPTVITNCSVSVNTTIPPIPTNPTNVFPLYRISYMLYAVFAILAALLIGTIVSLLTGRGQCESVDSSLTIPVAKKCCGCCISKECHCCRNARVQPNDGNLHQEYLGKPTEQTENGHVKNADQFNTPIHPVANSTTTDICKGNGHLKKESNCASIEMSDLRIRERVTGRDKAVGEIINSVKPTRS